MNDSPSLSPELAAAIETALDRHDLRILEIVFYIGGGVTILFSSIFIIHFIFILVMAFNPQIFNQPSHGGNAGPPPAGILIGFAVIVGLVILLGWIFGAAQIWAGRCLKQRRHRIPLMIVAGIECAFIPWGTALGVGTLIVLQRPSVAKLFI